MKAKGKPCLLVIIGLILFVIQCCEKGTTDPENKKFDIQYLVKLNGDHSVTSINVETYTYFPDENITAWIGKGKRRNEYNLYYSKENYLYDYDSIIIQPDEKAYSGCTKYMKVRFWFNEDKDTITYRDYVFQTDTLENEPDGKLSITWPDDSSKYKYYKHSYW